MMTLPAHLSHIKDREGCAGTKGLADTQEVETAKGMAQPQLGNNF